MQGFTPTWAEISLTAIANNVATIRALTKAPLLAAIKSDAYGHGAVTVSRLLSDLGAAYLGVANVGEALELRAAGLTTPILVLGYTPPTLTDILLEHRLTQTIFSFEMARAFSEKAAGRRLPVHLKVDTGMSRLGFVWQGEATLDALQAVTALSGLDVEGLFTHLPASEIPDDPLTLQQIRTFETICAAMVDRIGRKISLCHCANSGAVIHYPQAAMDMVRVGLLLYGLRPDPGCRPDLSLMPAMRFCSTVSQVKTIARGATVSYGRTYEARGPMKLAVVAAGYADGYPRILSDRAHVLIRGARAPIVGRVCMDMLMADVSALPSVSAGDEVTLFGQAADAALPVDELAALADTISYEMITGIGRRVPRVYWENGRQVCVVNHLRQPL